MPDRLHLSARHRRVLVALLREHLPDVEVWAYGNRVNGLDHDGSDLDLVLRGPGLDEIPIERLMDFEEAVGESTIPFLVEARDWVRLPERFHREIERGHVVVAEGSPSFSGHDVEWRRSTWGDEITLEYGKARKGESAKTGAYRVYGSNGPIGWTDVALAPGPGVVLGRKGAYRGVEYSPEPFWVIDTAYHVASKRKHDIRWLFYAIKHYKIGEIDDGSPVPSTTRAAVYPCKLTVPPLPEQCAIAHILGTLDDKIEVNRRMNETLEAMSRALFKSWFVDFDPVRAKMEGRDTGLPQDLAELFPDRLVDSETGEIPDGWQQGTLNDLARLNPESWSSHNAPCRIRYVDLANTKWGSINDIQEFTWQDAPSRGRRVLRRGDTIVGTVRPRNGSFALIDRDGLTGSTAFAVLRPATPTAREFVWCAATSQEAIERLGHLADGGAYPAVRPAAVLGHRRGTSKPADPIGVFLSGRALGKPNGSDSA